MPDDITPDVAVATTKGEKATRTLASTEGRRRPILSLCGAKSFTGWGLIMPVKAFAVPAVVLLSQACYAQVGDVRGVHDPAIARAGETFYLFSTHGGIQIRTSVDLIHWDEAGEVFAELPEWTRREVPGVRGLWAPDIAFFDGEWHLYYSVSTFGSNRSCIGLATNATLDPADERYRWVDQGKVIESVPGEDHWNAIDPAVGFDSDGTPWLAWGSFWGGLRMTRLDPTTGKPAGDEHVRLAWRPGDAIEAPCLFRRGDYYYLFASVERCCRGAESTYRIVVGRSKEITGPYVDREELPMTNGGGSHVLAGYGRFRGPGHCAVLSHGGTDWLVHHFYDAETQDRRGRPGVSTLQVRKLIWSRDGWPLAGEPVTLPEP